ADRARRLGQPVGTGGAPARAHVRGSDDRLGGARRRGRALRLPAAPAGPRSAHRAADQRPRGLLLPAAARVDLLHDAVQAVRPLRAQRRHADNALLDRRIPDQLDAADRHPHSRLPHGGADPARDQDADRTRHARDVVRPRRGGDDGNRRRPRRRVHLLRRIRARRGGRGDERAVPVEHVSARGVQRGLDRVHSGGRDRLLVVRVPGRDRLLHPDRLPAHPALRDLRRAGAREGVTVSDLPETPRAPEPGIGVDEWVARSAERILGRGGLAGQVQRRLEQVPAPLRFASAAGLAALIPVITSDDYLIRVATVTAVYCLLALGLNVAVGFAGLLDLGYIAYYGFGAYGYAMLSSSKFGVHWQAWASIPVVVCAAIALGFLLALPSR